MAETRCWRLLRVVAAFLAIALMGGAVYGWPSMRPILRREGALRSSTCGTIPANQACNDQELSFGVIFTIGSWANQGGRLLVGIVLDRIGPRWTSFACALVCSIGSAVFAVTSTTSGLSAGFACVGIGGAGMQLSLQSVSALFPEQKGLVMAMLSGAFQAASFIFLMFETLHRFLDVSLQTLMLGYAAVLFVASLVCLAIWPMRPFNSSYAQAAKGVSSSAAGVQEDASKTTGTLPLNKRCFRDQVLSPEYLLMVFFFTSSVVQAQFTIGTIGIQLELKGDDGDLTRFFNLIFSLSWTVTPLVGHMIDRCGCARVLIVMNTVFLCSCACLLSPWQGLQFATAILYTLGRVSIWAAFFSFNGSVFGFANYGKLAGGGLFIASCFSLVQYPLLELTLGVFEGDFAYVNSFFIAVCLTMYPVLARLALHLAKSNIKDAIKKGPERKSDISPSYEDRQDEPGGSTLEQQEGTAVTASSDTNGSFKPVVAV